MPDSYQIKSREVASHSDDSGTTRLYRAGKRWQLLTGLGRTQGSGGNRWASDDEACAFLQEHGPAEALAEFFPGVAPEPKPFGGTVPEEPVPARDDDPDFEDPFARQAS